jgi:O-antigen/teichoic acid export membrane protein
VGRALSWLGLGQLAGQVWWYGSLVALGALLSPRDFGTIAAGLVVVQIAQFLMDSGTRGSLIVAPRVSAALLRRALAFNVGTGLLLTLAVAALARPFVEAFASGGQAGAIRFLALAVVLSALVPVPMAILQRKLDFKRQATVLGVAATVASVAAIAAALLDAGVWALALRQVLYQAMIACLAWWSVRKILPRREPRSESGPVRQRQASWFFLVSLSQFLALNVDFLVVGGVTDARRLGLYSLAFTIAFAPVTQFSNQIGKVVFPAAAATGDLEVVAGRALKATRLLALITAPLVPAAIAVAPAVLPAVFGEEWQSMVLPFQILLAAAAGQVLLSVVQESLSGTGNVAFFATVSMVWLAATVAVLLVLVPLEGIRGAALTHAILLVPLAAAYATGGARRIGLSTRRLVAGLRGILGAVAVQAALTAGVVVGLDALGVHPDLAAATGALAGLLAVALVLARLPDRPLQEARAAVAALRSGGA